MEKEIKNVSTLGQLDGIYQIVDDNFIYMVDEDAKINIQENVNACIIDESLKKNIEVNVSRNASLKYIVVSTKNSKRCFNVYGSLDYVEVSLDKSNEELVVNLNYEAATFNGKTLAVGKNINSLFLQRVNHNYKKTVSNISNYGIAIENTNIKFDTTGFIEKNMANSNCRQLSRGIILDDNSSVESKPILLINEYDCFANHGAAIGKMSDEDLFYLMSRGLTKNEAFLLILRGIFKPFVDELVLDELKEEIDKKINDLVYEEK